MEMDTLENYLVWILLYIAIHLLFETHRLKKRIEELEKKHGIER
jgi:hypothetical protein